MLCDHEYNNLLLPEAKSGRALRRVEHDVLTLQEDVTEDGKSNAAVRLDSTEAGGAVNRGVVHIRTRN